MAFHLYSFVGRELTLRKAVEGLTNVDVRALRFGLALFPVTRAIEEQLGGPADPLYIELLHLTPALARWGEEASSRGPLAYVEAEFADREGWQAAVAWRSGQRVLGPIYAAGRGPLNEALRFLGVVPRGSDEFDAVELGNYGAL